MSKRRDWQDVVSEYLASGEPLTRYCRRRRLSYSATHYWVRKLGKQAGEKKQAVEAARVQPATFVEISASPPRQDAIGAYRIILENGRRLEVAQGFDATVLASILRVCESC